MKKSHIALIIVIAILIGAMVTAINDSSSYADFSEAFSEPSGEFHVVGKLNRDRQMIYDPVSNPDEFIFYMTDIKNEEKKVVLHKSKPQDFERSEQIVLIGSAQGDEFHANDILMKCPSKYQDGEITAKDQSQI
ncbi:MAG TPA: cytochrome C biogenesis protein [Flavobacteriales bacterium]|nr:cytochrome c maturation protein CcmE [Flavobacteriales bacterium]MDB9701685.1 cytochrome c maturation protein CcmE [Salibacteraceae bacterium]HAW19450.1 cytochrome C biogenesis protein [Flavobacteriales bacterium]